MLMQIVRGALNMLVIFPSANETGTLSNLAADFETAGYYTIASMIEETLADTKIKHGYPAPPPEDSWGRLLRKQKIDVVVAGSIHASSAESIRASGIRIVSGARGLVGDLIDWIADVGIDEFEEKVTLLTKKPAQPAKPAPAQAAAKQVDPVVTKAPAGQQPPSSG